MSRIAGLVWMGLFAVSASAADPKLGDGRDEVIAALDEPRGRMLIGRVEALFFERGTVELTDGRVTSVKLLAPEQLAAQKMATQELERLQAERQRQLLVEGTAEKAMTLADVEFARKTPAEQAAYWEQFARKYPGVPVKEQLQEAVRARQVEEQKKHEVDQAVAASAALKAKAAEPERRLSSSKRRRQARSPSDDKQAVPPTP